MRIIFNIFSSFFDLIKHIYLQIKGYLIFGKRVGVLGNFIVENPANVSIGSNCGINHDVYIVGNNSVQIGNNVVISARVMLIDTGLDVKGYSNDAFPKHIKSFIRIKDGVWIGAGAIILPGVTIGTKSIVGAGSVVTRDVPDFTIVAGNPARQIGRTDNLMK